MTRTTLKVWIVVLMGLVSTVQTTGNDYTQVIREPNHRSHHHGIRHQQLHQNEYNESTDDRSNSRNEAESLDHKQHILPTGYRKSSYKKHPKSLPNQHLDYERNEENHIDKKESDEKDWNGAFHCPKCMHPNYNNNSPEETTDTRFSRDELTQLRIELVKQQILEKLRLKERPRVAAIDLPKPISEGATIEQETANDGKLGELDDYYARTSKKFIFLEIGTRLKYFNLKMKGCEYHFRGFVSFLFL